MTDDLSHKRSVSLDDRLPGASVTPFCVLEETMLEGLGISRRLFLEVRNEGISLCHWKSNSHLAEAVAGKTDLDILVGKGDREKFERVLSKLDFKKMIPPSDQRYPGMEDYLGFDAETGGLIHLHVHYELIMGRQKVKNHHLPLESFVLDHVRDIEGIPVPQAEVELLLLIIRAHMKLGL